MTNNLDLHAPAFFLADHTAVESGKLYVNGGFWSRLNFPSFPAVTTFGVAVVLSIPWRAYHQPHKFSVWFEDADGKKFGGDIGGDFTVGASPEMKVGDSTIMPIAALVGNFMIPNPGDYAAVLSVDGQELSRWSFRAIQIFTQAVSTRPFPAIDPSEGE